MLAVSVGLSATFSAAFSVSASWGRSCGLSIAAFSRTAFSEIPFALTPGSGKLDTSDVSDGLVSSFTVSSATPPLAFEFDPKIADIAAATGVVVVELLTM
jgi:hypothetical protein